VRGEAAAAAGMEKEDGGGVGRDLGEGGRGGRSERREGWDLGGGREVGLERQEGGMEGVEKGAGERGGCGVVLPFLPLRPLPPLHPTSGEASWGEMEGRETEAERTDSEGMGKGQM
jgi:hypothetical protein